jgi:hypothetical protein
MKYGDALFESSASARSVYGSPADLDGQLPQPLKQAPRHAHIHILLHVVAPILSAPPAIDSVNEPVCAHHHAKRAEFEGIAQVKLQRAGPHHELNGLDSIKALVEVSARYLNKKTERGGFTFVLCPCCVEVQQRKPSIFSRMAWLHPDNRGNQDSRLRTWDSRRRLRRK